MTGYTEVDPANRPKTALPELNLWIADDTYFNRPNHSKMLVFIGDLQG
jgi:hypothetical protein